MLTVVRHRIDGLESHEMTLKRLRCVRHRIDGLEIHGLILEGF